MRYAPLGRATRLRIALLLGGLIGLNRELKGHAAGLRINMLVALGTGLFRILALSGFNTSRGATDPARIAAQIGSGIGFLGAAEEGHPIRVPYKARIAEGSTKDTKPREGRERTGPSPPGTHLAT